MRYGKVTCNNKNNVESQCELICDLGLMTVGSKLTTCLSDGTWSEEIGYCKGEVRFKKIDSGFFQF